uniref:Uncharacterized protein n=1 Tax=viral metagenome TaxID=1070528 RepID=A0A6C0EII8_9ZZZZ
MFTYISSLLNTLFSYHYILFKKSNNAEILNLKNTELKMHIENKFKFSNHLIINQAINNIFFGINILYNTYKKSKNDIIKLLGSELYVNKIKHIISDSLNFNYLDIIYDDSIENIIKLIKTNIYVIFDEIINILKKFDNIYQAQISRELGFINSKDFNYNHFVTYDFLEIMELINIINFKKIIKRKYIILNNKDNKELFDKNFNHYTIINENTNDSSKIINLDKQTEIIIENTIDSSKIINVEKKKKLKIHSAYIDERIKDTIKSEKWNDNYIINTPHLNYIKAYSSNIYTNLIKDIFTKTYLKKYPCSDCGNPSTDRCHGINEERPKLIQKALDKVYPDITKPIEQKKIIIAFLEEHKYTNFTFKCKECHVKEKHYTI